MVTINSENYSIRKGAIMARKTKYNLSVLRDLVVAGKTKSEIMREMGIKNGPTFNNLMLKLMDEDRKYYQVKELRKTRKTKSSRPPVVKIGKNNTLTLSAKTLESTTFKPGDSFVVKSTKTRINLIPVDK
jgi:hexokinase